MHNQHYTAHRLTLTRAAGDGRDGDAPHEQPPVGPRQQAAHKLLDSPIARAEEDAVVAAGIVALPELDRVPRVLRAVQLHLHARPAQQRGHALLEEHRCRAAAAVRVQHGKDAACLVGRRGRSRCS